MSRPLVLIVGMLSTKDSAGFLRNFAGLARRVIAVPIPRQDKSVPAEALADIARGVGIPARAAATASKPRSPRSARLDLDPPPRILITGSLYLAGEVLARERHAAGCDAIARHFSSFIRSAFFCLHLIHRALLRRLVGPPAHQPVPWRKRSPVKWS